MLKFLMFAAIAVAVVFGVVEILNQIADHFAPLGCALNTACNRASIK